MFGGNNTSKEYTESAARELSNEDNKTTTIINKENEEDKRNRTFYGVLNDLRILDLGKGSLSSLFLLLLLFVVLPLLLLLLLLIYLFISSLHSFVFLFLFVYYRYVLSLRNICLAKSPTEGRKGMALCKIWSFNGQH